MKVVPNSGSRRCVRGGCRLPGAEERKYSRTFPSGTDMPAAIVVSAAAAGFRQARSVRRFNRNQGAGSPPEHVKPGFPEPVRPVPGEGASLPGRDSFKWFHDVYEEEAGAFRGEENRAVPDVSFRPFPIRWAVRMLPLLQRQRPVPRGGSGPSLESILCRGSCYALTEQYSSKASFRFWAIISGERPSI